VFIEVDENFLDHPKTRRFCLAMGTELAATYILRLWSWATKYAKDGDLTSFSEAEIEDVVRYRNMDGKCFAALVACRFIDVDANGRAVIHGWMDHQGKWIRKLEADRARMKERRTGRRAADTQETDACLHDLAETEKQTELPVTNSSATVARPSRERSSDVAGNLAKHSVADQKESAPAERSLPSEPGSPAERRRRTRTAVEYDPLFLDLFALYPRKDGKALAQERWVEAGRPVEAVKSALAWQVPHWQSKAASGYEPPHFSTYLSQRRWEDEPPPGIAARAQLAQTARKLLVATPDLFGAKGTGDVPA